MQNHYLTHLAGIASLLSWIGRAAPLVNPPTAEGSWVHVGPVLSRRIVLGLPLRRRYGFHPFLAFQADERVWVDRIQWKRAVHISGTQSLVLVARAFHAEDETTVDLPAFGVHLEFDDSRKTQAALSTGRLEARSLRFDAAGVAHIGRHAPRSWLIQTVESWDAVLSDYERKGHRDFAGLVKAQIARTNQEVDPGYRGSRSEVGTELRHLVSPFDRSAISPVRPD